jgi:hypothetical protein
MALRSIGRVYMGRRWSKWPRAHAATPILLAGPPRSSPFANAYQAVAIIIGNPQTTAGAR